MRLKNLSKEERNKETQLCSFLFPLLQHTQHTHCKNKKKKTEQTQLYTRSLSYKYYGKTSMRDLKPRP